MAITSLSLACANQQTLRQAFPLDMYDFCWKTIFSKADYEKPLELSPEFHFSKLNLKLSFLMVFSENTVKLGSLAVISEAFTQSKNATFRTRFSNRFFWKGISNIVF